MTFSLRQELDKVPEHEAVEEVEEAMYANDQACCEISAFGSKIKCDYKITRKEMEKEYNDDYEAVSNELWSHRYGHCRTYKRDRN